MRSHSKALAACSLFLAAVALIVAGVRFYLAREVPLGSQPTADLFRRGQDLAIHGEYARAVQAYDALLRQDPSHEAATIYKAECQGLLGDRVAQIETLALLVQAHPSPQNRRRLEVARAESAREAKGRDAKERR